MPWQSVKLVPGLDTEQTPSLLEGRYTTASFVRWREGLIEKLGGWTQWYPSNLDSTIRELHAWQSLNNVDYLAVGTTQHLFAIGNSTIIDLTPQTLTSSITPNFTTTLGSSTVTIVDSNTSNLTSFDTLNIQIPVVIGGIILSGPYTISSIVSSTSYTITASSNATSGVSNAGSVPSLTTLNGSAYVTCTLTGHGLSVGNDVNFPVSTTIGGLTIQGNYSVISITDANNFVFAASSAATSAAGPTAMNGGKTSILYNIGIGPVQGGGGWSVGGYGVGGYGSGSTFSSQTGTFISPGDWTLVHWGEDLIVCPKNGTLYYWPPEGGGQTSYPVPNAPSVNTGVMVAMPQLVLVAWGSTSQLSLGYAQDPLLVKWCQPGDFTNWTISNATLAGDFRLSRGSKIVGGFQSTFRTLLWTDIECWAMDWIGYPYAFQFNCIGTQCGLASRAAVAELGGVVYWMSPANFYVLMGGQVRPLPCPVYDAVFQDLDTSNLSKIRVGANTAFNEIWFFYPSVSGGSGENDKYVKYNTVENAWDSGSLARSAWLGQSVLGSPIGAQGATLYQHETGYQAGNLPMNSTWSTGWIALTEGQDFPFIDQIIPDMRWNTWNSLNQSSVQLSFKSAAYPSDTPYSYGPYSVAPTTQYIPPRIRNRLISMQFSDNGSSTFWRLGRPRFRIAPSGRR